MDLDLIEAKIETNLTNLDSPDKKDIPCFLADFLNYLRDYGFIISSDMQAKFFQVAADAEISLFSPQEVYQVLKLIVCKNQMEVKNFREIFFAYIKKEERIAPGGKKKNKAKKAVTYESLKQKEEYWKVQYEQRIQHEKDLGEDKEQIERNLEQNQKEIDGKPFFKPTKKQQKEIKELLMNIKEVGSTWKTAFNKITKEGKESLNYLIKEEWKKGIHPDRSDMKFVNERLEELLDYSFKGRKPEQMMEIVEQLIRLHKMIEVHEKKYGDKLLSKQEQYRAELKSLQNEQQNNQNRINCLLKEIKNTQEQMTAVSVTADELSIFVKEHSTIHRKDFMTRGNAVECLGDLGEIGEREFKKLTDDEKLWIYTYIRKNARRFMTRIMRNINTDEKKLLNVKDTIFYAMSSGGIPMKLQYEKPKPNKPKLILFLDISGSCKKASEMMLVFMYYMKKVFTGGCKTYVFVNQLYDISEMMNVDDAESCVKRVLENIPTKGIYSDYYEPLKYYYEEKMSELTKDSIVLFIGDARNNKNESGEDFIKRIARRVKRTYWLNTEEILRWSTGDSIMNIYEKYMNKTLEVCTPRHLLEFLLSIH